MPRKNRRNARQLPISLILAVGGGLLVLAAAILLLMNPPSTSTVTPTSGGPYPEIARAGLRQAKAAYDGGQAVFLDVRSAEQYAADHIPGAVHIPLNELPARLSELDANAWIIPYCT